MLPSVVAVQVVRLRSLVVFGGSALYAFSMKTIGARLVLSYLSPSMQHACLLFGWACSGSTSALHARWKLVCRSLCGCSWTVVVAPCAWVRSSCSLASANRHRRHRATCRLPSGARPVRAELVRQPEHPLPIPRVHGVRGGPRSGPPPPPPPPTHTRRTLHHTTPHHTTHPPTHTPTHTRAHFL
jgi:hypothetical protein